MYSTNDDAARKTQELADQLQRERDYEAAKRKAYGVPRSRKEIENKKQASRNRAEKRRRNKKGQNHGKRKK